MSSKIAVVFGCATLLATPLSVVFADEAGATSGSTEAAEPVVDEAMEAEIRYVEALIDAGYPDFAEPIIAATKKRWPESEARFFALEIRGLLSLGKFEAAEKRIAALPDRKGAKYWAARLEVAMNYFVRNQKEECAKIYDEFFATFKNPTKDMRKFYMDASYTFGQMLKSDKNYARAVQIYEGLLRQIKDKDTDWCNLVCEVTEMYLKIASEEKNAKKKAESLNAAEKLADQLLWREDEPIFFGRALSMKAHIEQMRGNVDRAEEIIEEYKPQLQDLHDQIVANDPDGKHGLLNLSPLPECLYLQAQILWEEVQAEMKKPKRNDDRIKDMLFGPKDKRTSKRDGRKGAFQMAINVFINYESSAWAVPAGELQETIRSFAEKTYGAKIKTKISPEQIAKARARQFQNAAEKYLAGQYNEAIADYFAVLAKYPELPESISAVENIANSYLDLLVDAKTDAEKDEYRLNADAVEGYLAERFAGASKVVMTDAGNAVIRLAAKEKERQQLARADRLYTAFVTNYREHPSAVNIAASKAAEAEKAGRFADALKFWGLIKDFYTNSNFYAASFARLSYCSGQLGDRKDEIAYMKDYLPLEKNELPRLQAKMQLAQMYLKDSLSLLENAQTNEVPEEVSKNETEGSKQCIRAIQQFKSSAEEAVKQLKDPATLKEDIEKYEMIRERALYRVADSWWRLRKPAEKRDDFRKRAAEGYEDYLKAYPDGEFSTNAYVRLGTIYTALGELEKSKDALDRLSRKYPDSDEAKNAKPRLAKSLIEMGMKREGTELYAEMLRTDGKYTAQQFINAGEALIGAKSWELANQAFEKAISLAGAKQYSTIAKARLGEARCAFMQGSLAEAREALDAFLGDQNLSRLTLAADANFLLVDVASAQGLHEKDAVLRNKYFGAAVGALKKVRNYWSKKPQWEQDQLTLMSGDVLIRRMNAEMEMGLKDEALETCERAAATFQVFLQSRGVTPEHPVDKMSPEELANLERCYTTMVPLFAKLGSEKSKLVIRFGEEYLELFPNGKGRTEIVNCINNAKADMTSSSCVPAASIESQTEGK